MICKFFKTQKGGGVSSVDYMLNERVNQGTARILKGDEFLTRELIKSMSQKHKTCVGVLSFEEKNIDENTKKEIMQSFENALLTPAMQGRYNILWIEHTDKGRLELNFIIPKMDLESKKSFNPYYHPIDNKRIDFWRDFVNLCYGFTNPKDPSKEQTLPESKKAKRFKGGIYNEQFRSFEKLRDLRTEKESRAREYQQRDIKSELERTKRELDKFIQSKDEYYRETIRKFNERLQGKTRKFNRKNGEIQLQDTANEIQNIQPSNEFFSGNAYDDDFKRSCMVSVDKTLSDQQGANNKIEQRENLYTNAERECDSARQLLLPTTRLEKAENDDFRIRINSRNREITGQDNRISTSRDEITRDNQERTNSIRERFGSYEKQTQQLRAGFQGFETENTRNGAIKRARIETIRDIIQAKYTELRERIRNSFKKTINKARQIKRDFGYSR
ncbi:relaxase/mobilization nuclease domain-containing protein [Campylobacter jejuni]|nr:mobilization protein [Campylobacter jejuni]EGM9245390.1 relaxase/mobilization nuclease domain-containing protein [Campylobacter jejuni]ELM7270202.1 relaxase/mobilization nuclease domain-containing protein [Campylobacter jejuni]